MSFRGFKKSINRKSQAALQKIGKADVTVDEEFDTLEHNFQELKKAVAATSEFFKRYLAGLPALPPAQLGLAGALAAVSDPSGQHPEYQRAAEVGDMEARTLANEIRTNCVPRLEEYKESFKQIQDAINDRRKRLLDYDRSRNKVLGMRGNAASDPAKLQQEEYHLQELEERYIEVNAAVKRDVSLFYQDRVIVLSEIFEMLLVAQKNYYGRVLAALEDVTVYNWQNHRSEYYAQVGDPPRVANPNSIMERPQPPRQQQQLQFAYEEDPEFAYDDGGGYGGGGDAYDDGGGYGGGGGGGIATHVALYDYDGDEGDLSFREGDQITVLDEGDGDWWTCMLDGRTGKAPRNFLERL